MPRTTLPLIAAVAFASLAAVLPAGQAETIDPCGNAAYATACDPFAAQQCVPPADLAVVSVAGSNVCAAASAENHCVLSTSGDDGQGWSGLGGENCLSGTSTVQASGSEETVSTTSVADLVNRYEEKVSAVSVAGLVDVDGGF